MISDFLDISSHLYTYLLSFVQYLIRIFSILVYLTKTDNAKLRNPTDTGMSRLTLSDADKSVRDWFVSTTKSLGCEIKIDAMGILPPLYSPDTPSLTTTFLGNIFAIRPGKKDAPPTYAGSHLDTQVTHSLFVSSMTFSYRSREVDAW